MKITITRCAMRSTYTIGRMEIDGRYVCDTLEPPSRKLSARMPLALILRAKAEGAAAIPTGTYGVEMTYSPRFRRQLPLLTGVPGFDAIRIHPGNYPRDTCGCILPGWNRRRGMVCGSLSAMSLITGSITRALASHGPVTLTVKERR